MKMPRVFLALAVCMLIVSCKTTDQSKMNFEDARDVVLSMQSIPLEPPGRHSGTHPSRPLRSISVLQNPK